MTVPYEQNQTITPGANVNSMVFGDGTVYVQCADGSNCEVTIGDGSGNDDSSTSTDSHDDTAGRGRGLQVWR